MSEHLADVHRPATSRVAVFRALYLGDMLCAVPALRALRRRFPAAQIALVGLPWARDLMTRFPYADRFEDFPGYPDLPEVPYDPDLTTAFLRRLRDERFDIAIQMHGDGRTSNAFVAALGARAAIGFRRDGRDDRLTLSLPWDPDEQETRRCLRLVGVLGADTQDETLEFPVGPAEDREAVLLLGDVPFGIGPLIGLHPGAKDPARRWPTARFADLADRLHAQYRARFVVTGGSAESTLAAEIRRQSVAPVLDLSGRTSSLGVFAALLSRLDLLVTNDTGASHLAAATGTRSVVLFGPTRPERWAPLDRQRHAVVDAMRFAPAGSDPESVLADLAVEPVFAASERVLKRGDSSLAAVAPAGGATGSLN